ncbi:hypothetical protein SLEP1_g11705 [Rubroshorea leprosula]|nr:hypothetical protein SLEP1_g11705 [Rubroshorea leprosula]
MWKKEKRKNHPYYRFSLNSMIVVNVDNLTHRVSSRKCSFVDWCLGFWEKIIQI